MPLNMQLAGHTTPAVIRPATAAILTMNGALRATNLAGYVLTLLNPEDIPGINLTNAIFWIAGDGAYIMVEHGLRVLSDIGAATSMLILVTADHFDEAQRNTIRSILASTRPSQETRRVIRPQG